MRGQEGCAKFCDLMRIYNLNETLDIGSGKEQTHAKYMRGQNLLVDTVDFFEECTITGNYNDLEMPHFYEGIHASHVLEHQLNVHSFLKKIHWDLQEGGFLCITVPPLKHQIVGGHISLWNAGLLLYHLVLAGFNCKEARIKQYGYNISVIIRKETVVLENLNYVGKDMHLIKKYLPPFKFTIPRPGAPGFFNGDIKEYNW